jgi:hypothetical protein
MQQLRDLQSMKKLAGKNLLASQSSKNKSKPPSVSAQFHVSLPSHVPVSMPW